MKSFFIISLFLLPFLASAMEEDLGKIRSKFLSKNSARRLHPLYWSNKTIEQSASYCSTAVALISCFTFPACFLTALGYEISIVGASCIGLLSSSMTGGIGCCINRSIQEEKLSREIARNSIPLDISFFDNNSSTVYPLSADKETIFLDLDDIV